MKKSFRAYIFEGRLYDREGLIPGMYSHGPLMIWGYSGTIRQK